MPGIIRFHVSADIDSPESAKVSPAAIFRPFTSRDL